ncbi:MAG: glycosyltransferase [Patescibacteria group bacterium]|jgi:glycosyltransferase involved in cell wall biosynthesis
MKTVDICLPIYNEEKILEKNVLFLLDFLKKQNYPFSWKIVILNNGSTDKSKEIGERLAEWGIKMENALRPGKGGAIKEYWMKSRADIACYMDIDLAVSLENISDLLVPLVNENCDMIIGSRLLYESKIDRSLIREISSQGYNLLSRLICDHKFSDLQCGFKAVRTDIFKKIAPFITDRKWFFDTELVIYAGKLGYKIKEVPVEWSENRYDKRKSKVNLFKDTLTFIINLLKLNRRMKKQGAGADRLEIPNI